MLNSEQRNNIIAASRRFQASYPGSLGFLFILYLYASDNLKRCYNVLDEKYLLIDIERDYLESSYGKTAKEWEEKGIENEALVALDNYSECFEEVWNIFYEDIFQHEVYYAPEAFFDTLQILEKVNPADILEDFYEISFDVIQRLQAYNYNDYYIQPSEITHLMWEVSQYKDGDIYNPFAGSASFCLSGDLSDSYHAEEIAPLPWALGILRLWAMGNINPDYAQGDSIKGWRTDLQPDLIISSVPWGMKIEKTDEGVLSKGSKEFVEEFYIRQGIKSLAPEGTLVGLFSLRTLYQGNNLGNNLDYLSKVILLPEKLFHFTDIQSAILVFDKKHSGCDDVMFVDASSMCSRNAKRNVLDWREVVSAVENADSNFVKLVSFDSIKKNKYNLLPTTYISDPLEGLNIPANSHLVPLKELCSFYQGVKESTDSVYIVKGKDLHASPSRQPLTWEQVDLCGTSGSYKILKKDALLVLMVGNKLKPTRFAYVPEHNVSCGSNVMALVPNDEVLIDYLVSELSKEYVNNQLELCRTKIGVPSLKKDSLAEIKIVVPNLLEQQEEILKEEIIRRQEDIIASLGERDRILTISQVERFEKNNRVRKHAIKQVLNELVPALDMLEYCRKEHNGVLEDSFVVAERTGETVAQYFQKLRYYVDKTLKLVNVLTDNEEYSKPEAIKIVDRLEQYKATHLCNDKYNIVLAFSQDFINGPEKDVRVNISVKDLDQILDNIITNACNHGFVDDTRKDYCIRISLEKEQINSSDFVVVCISNNGAPLNENISSEKVFAWGEGSGTGIGAWQVRNIAEHFGGSADLNINPDPEDDFTIEYRITLPIVNKD